MRIHIKPYFNIDVIVRRVYTFVKFELFNVTIRESKEYIFVSIILLTAHYYNVSYLGVYKSVESINHCQPRRMRPFRRLDDAHGRNS